MHVVDDAQPLRLPAQYVEPGLFVLAWAKVARVPDAMIK